MTAIPLPRSDTRPISVEIRASLRQSGVEVAAAHGVLLMAAGAAVCWLAGDEGARA